MRESFATFYLTIKEKDTKQYDKISYMELLHTSKKDGRHAKQYVRTLGLAGVVSLVAACGRYTPFTKSEKVAKYKAAVENMDNRELYEAQYIGGICAVYEDQKGPDATGGDCTDDGLQGETLPFKAGNYCLVASSYNTTPSYYDDTAVATPGDTGVEDSINIYPSVPGQPILRFVRVKNEGFADTLVPADDQTAGILELQHCVVPSPETLGGKGDVAH